MSSNTINCDKFKDAYMKCVDEKIVSRIKKFDISLDLGESCNEPFQNMKDCTEELYRQKISQIKK